MPKDIVVHLTGSDEDAVRLAYAEAIAREFEGHLTGVLQHILPQVIAAPDASFAGFIETAYAESRQRADAVQDRLAAQLAKLAVPHDLRRIEGFPGTIGGALAAEARLADLFVGTRPYGDPHGQERIEEAVLFHSGRACLFVPPGGTPPARYGTIMIAWKDSREAARAVSEALPFLRRASRVFVTVVEEDGASEELGQAVGTDIGRHLSRHGITAEIRPVSGWSSPAEALLNEARLGSADLIVMGGYGHSRFRQWLLGGVTRHMLTHADIPILTAH